MITIRQYNEAEAEAVMLEPQLHLDNMWGVVPETIGHIVTVQERSALLPLLNRFQCDRFRTYLYELGGLSKEDLDQFLDARIKIVTMQQTHWPELPVKIPVETMLSALAVYRKIKTARPMATTILEIGPGAGLNSLFFASDPAIRNYTQIEATQALYILQAMVNEVSYPEAWEAALPLMRVPTATTRVWHIPWWRVNDLYNTSIYYDVITANACLNEISDKIVDRYLELFAAKSHNNTLLLIQDVGGWGYRTEEAMKELLARAGWFIAASVDGVDIEGAIREQSPFMNCGRGDAVSTWWLTKNAKRFTPMLERRCDAGLSMLDADCQCFSVDGQCWTRANMEFLDPRGEQ